MSFFRKAYSVACAVLMIQFVVQLYLVAAAVLTIFQANDNAEDIYSAFKTADTFAGIHRANGDLAAVTIIVMVGCSFGARYPWRTTLLTAALFVLLFIQSTLAYMGIPLLSGLHGVNALILIGLGAYLTGRNWAFRRDVVGAGSLSRPSATSAREVAPPAESDPAGLGLASRS